MARQRGLPEVQRRGLRLQVTHAAATLYHVDHDWIIILHASVASGRAYCALETLAEARHPERCPELAKPPWLPTQGRRGRCICSRFRGDVPPAKTAPRPERSEGLIPRPRQLPRAWRESTAQLCGRLRCLMRLVIASETSSPSATAFFLPSHHIFRSSFPRSVCWFQSLSSGVVISSRRPFGSWK